MEKKNSIQEHQSSYLPCPTYLQDPIGQSSITYDDLVTTNSRDNHLFFLGFRISKTPDGGYPDALRILEIFREILIIVLWCEDYPPPPGPSDTTSHIRQLPPHHLQIYDHCTTCTLLPRTPYPYLRVTVTYIQHARHVQMYTHVHSRSCAHYQYVQITLTCTYRHMRIIPCVHIAVTYTFSCAYFHYVHIPVPCTFPPRARCTNVLIPVKYIPSLPSRAWATPPILPGGGPATTPHHYPPPRGVTSAACH